MLTMGDVQRFIDWYRTQGFEVIATNLNGEEGPVNWAEIKRRQRQLMLTAGDGAVHPGRHYALYRPGRCAVRGDRWPCRCALCADRSVLWPAGLRPG